MIQQYLWIIVCGIFCMSSAQAFELEADTTMEFGTPEATVPESAIQAMVEAQLNALSSAKGKLDLSPSRSQACQKEIQDNLGEEAVKIYTEIEEILARMTSTDPAVKRIDRVEALNEIFARIDSAENRKFILNEDEKANPTDAAKIRERNRVRGLLRGYLISAMAQATGRDESKTPLTTWEINRMSEAIQGKAVAFKMPSNLPEGKRPQAPKLDYKIMANRLKGGAPALHSYAYAEAIESYASVFESLEAGDRDSRGRKIRNSRTTVEKLLGAPVRAPSDKFCSQSQVVMARQAAKAVGLKTNIKDAPAAINIAKATGNPVAGGKIDKKPLVDTYDNLGLYPSWLLRSNGRKHAFAVNVRVVRLPDGKESYRYRRINFNINHTEDHGNDVAGAARGARGTGLVNVFQ